MFCKAIRLVSACALVSSLVACGQSSSGSAVSDIAPWPAPAPIQGFSCPKAGTNERLVLSYQDSLPYGTIAQMTISKGLLTTAPFYGSESADGALALRTFSESDDLVTVTEHGKLVIMATATLPSTTYMSWTKLDGTTVGYGPCAAL